jgi:hypothetical protein
MCVPCKKRGKKKGKQDAPQQELGGLDRELAPSRIEISLVDDLKKEQQKLDVRGNDVEATQHESSWAVNLANNLSKENKALLQGHARSIAEMAGDEDLRLALVNLPENSSGAELVEILVGNQVNFKGAVDQVGGQIGHDNPGLKNRARKQRFFERRGRRVMEDDEMQRRQSFSDPHGGITDSLHRTPSTRDIFSQPVGHAKGFIRGVAPDDPEYETYKEFQDSGAPFIGGASGTMQFLSMMLETEEPPRGLDEREKLLALHMAVLLTGGHHSMSECLLAVKCYGYFKDVPDPLENYDGAMAALDNRFAELGLSVKDKPLCKKS